jgi:hypothetical protein
MRLQTAGTPSKAAGPPTRQQQGGEEPGIEKRRRLHARGVARFVKSRLTFVRGIYSTVIDLAPSHANTLIQWDPKNLASHLLVHGHPWGVLNSQNRPPHNRQHTKPSIPDEPNMGFVERNRTR